MALYCGIADEAGVCRTAAAGCSLSLLFKVGATATAVICGIGSKSRTCRIMHASLGRLEPGRHRTKIRHCANGRKAAGRLETPSGPAPTATVTAVARLHVCQRRPDPT